MLITRKLKIEKLVFELSEDEAREFASDLRRYLTPCVPNPKMPFSHGFMHELTRLLEV